MPGNLMASRAARLTSVLLCAHSFSTQVKVASGEAVCSADAPTPARSLLQLSGAPSTAPSPPRRRVYIDMGANWANTLRLYHDIASDKDWDAKNWEVYAFEASPLIQPYLEMFVSYLNGEAEKPALTVPPAGSTGHLMHYIGAFGCAVNSEEGDHATRLKKQTKCMENLFADALDAIHPDPRLNSTQLVKDRLSLAAHPLASDATRPRFTHIPAAVGAKDGWLELGHASLRKMIRGGAVSSDTQGDNYKVVAADVVSWLEENFSEDDYVVLKMDVEGAEFGILEGLYNAGKLHLIDLLAYECHDWVKDEPVPFQDCAAMTATLEREHMQTMTEHRGYEGWDSFSTPSLYMPIDPRSG